MAQRVDSPDGKELSGVVVDIDSIRNVDLTDYAAFAAALEPGLEQLRQENKMKFFRLPYRSKRLKKWDLFMNEIVKVPCAFRNCCCDGPSSCHSHWSCDLA